MGVYVYGFVCVYYVCIWRDKDEAVKSSQRRRVKKEDK